MVITNEKSIEYINQVNEFYNSAWEKLIIGGGVFIALVGIILPILIQFWQNQNLKHREKLLLDELKIKIDEAKIELRSVIENEVLQQNIQFKKDVDIKLESTQGKLLHNQGNFFFQTNNDKALYSFIRSSYHYINSKDQVLLLKIIGMMLYIIKKMTKKEIEEFEEKRNLTLKEFIEKIELSDYKELCQEKIYKLKMLLKEK